MSPTSYRTAPPRVAKTTPHHSTALRAAHDEHTPPTIEPTAIDLTVNGTDASEIELNVQLGEPRRHHRRRQEPGPAGDERLVVAERRRRVEQIVDVRADVRPPPVETQELRDAEIEFVDAVAVERTG